MSENRGSSNIPIELVDRVAVGHDNVEVIVEAQLVDSEPVHVHLHLELRPDEYVLVRRKPQLIKTLVVDQDIDEVHVNLEVSYREGVQLEESVVDHLDQLRIQGVIHHEDLDVCLVLVLGTDSVPEVHSHQIGNSAEGVLNHLDPPLRNKVVSHEGVLEVPTLDNLPVGHIDKDELVEVDLPHDEGSAVRHNVGPSMGQNLIDVVAMQNFTAL